MWGGGSAGKTSVRGRGCEIATDAETRRRSIRSRRAAPRGCLVAGGGEHSTRASYRLLTKNISPRHRTGHRVLSPCFPRASSFSSHLPARRASPDPRAASPRAPSRRAGVPRAVASSAPPARPRDEKAREREPPRFPSPPRASRRPSVRARHAPPAPRARARGGSRRARPPRLPRAHVHGSRRLGRFQRPAPPRGGDDPVRGCPRSRRSPARRRRGRRARGRRRQRHRRTPPRVGG